MEMMTLGNFKTKYIERKISQIYLILISIWTVPWLLNMPSSGIDPSWIIGINIAASEHMQFGKDIIFTFGPLGYLYFPFYLDNSLWILSLLFTLFIHFSFFFALGILLDKLSNNWIEYVFVLLMLIIPINFIRDYKILILAILLLYLNLTHSFDQKYEFKLLSFTTLLLAIASLIKFNMTISSLSILIAFSLICLIEKKTNKIAITIISYFSFILILWIGAGQNLANLPQYLLNGYRISSGYSNAMTINGPEWQLIIGLICMLFIVILFIYSLLKSRDKLLVLIVLTMGILFFSFKHGFVRHDDGHVYSFFAVHSIFYLCVYFVEKNNANYLPRLFSLLMFIVFVVSIFAGFPHIMDENIIQKSSAYESSLPLLNSETFQNTVLNNAKSNIKNNYPLDNRTIQYLDNKSIDIFPWDIALIWAYNLDWSPRPIFQSYSAYTHDLDELNAQHFYGDSAPEVLLYSYKSIDGRYPIFDEPKTFMTVLCNYSLVDQSGEFLILSHNAPSNANISPEDLGTSYVKIGQPISIPEYNDGYVIGYVDLDYSIIGEVANFLYKPSSAYIRFRSYDSTYSNNFRFIPDTASNGIFLSQYISTKNELSSIFSGNIKQDISEITIDVDNPIHYKKNIQVNFVGIPANVSVQNSSHYLPEWQSLKSVTGGMMAIDSFNNQLYSEGNDTLYIDKSVDEYITIQGWAVDNLNKNGDVKTYLVFKNNADEIVFPTKRTQRSDVSSFFGVESYNNSGWESVVRTQDIESKCYDISLRIIRLNGEEYFELNEDKTVCFY